MTVPPTPPMSDSVYAVENGDRAAAPDQSAPDHSTISSADAMIAPNFRPMNHLMIVEEALVSPEPHHHERRDRVNHAPHRQRHRRDDRRRNQRAGGDERARHEVAPDDEVDEEREHGRARQVIAPALDERGSRTELPACSPLGDGELEDDAGGEGPHEREPVFGAGNRGRNHVADTDAGGGEQEPGADVRELHEVAGIVDASSE